MSKRRPRFGVIDESLFTLITPRTCNEGFELLEDAFASAYGMIDDGASRVAIVHVDYNEDTDSWYEIVNGNIIAIDAAAWDWDYEED